LFLLLNAAKLCKLLNLLLLFGLLPIPVGLNLPRLDVAAPHYGGSWASASSAVFTNLFKVHHHMLRQN
jgi:hypothetical protein